MQTQRGWPFACHWACPWRNWVLLVATVVWHSSDTNNEHSLGSKQLGIYDFTNFVCRPVATSFFLAPLTM